ncbi:MAG: hypothetical protein AABX29_06000 [Nanoarchaeota archaeon]
MDNYFASGLVSIVIFFYLYKKGVFSGYSTFFNMSSYRIIFDNSVHFSKRLFKLITLVLLLLLMLLIITIFSLFTDKDSKVIEFFEKIIMFLPNFIFGVAILSIILYFFLPKDNSWADKWVDEQINKK